MSGYEIFKKAILRLGYDGALNKSFDERSLELLNQIASDLKLPIIENLVQPLLLTPEQNEALCCGLAMLLALSEGDAEKNEIFANIYNSKRAALLSEQQKIQDVLPGMAGGEA